jgi:exonuclease I
VTILFIKHSINGKLTLFVVVDDIIIVGNNEVPIKLLCDNKSPISMIYNPIQHDRTKHVEIDRNFIQEKLDSSFIATTYIPLGLHLADVYTKGLLVPQNSFKILLAGWE